MVFLYFSYFWCPVGFCRTFYRRTNWLSGFEKQLSWRQTEIFFKMLFLSFWQYFFFLYECYIVNFFTINLFDWYHKSARVFVKNAGKCCRRSTSGWEPAPPSSLLLLSSSPLSTTPGGTFYPPLIVTIYFINFICHSMLAVFCVLFSLW